MSATNNPANNQGWLSRLKDGLSTILNFIGEAGTRVFSALWSFVVRAWYAARDFAIAHPKIVIAIVIFILAVLFGHPFAEGIVTELGFGSHGVRAGSFASRLQASLYGGHVPSGSLFSFLQSFGASA